MYPYNQQWLPFPPQQPTLNSRFVTSIEEARASMIDAFSTNLFVDTSTGKIYLKKMNNNGQADFFTYAIEEQKAPVDPLKEINERLTKIENYIGGRSESVSVNAESAVTKSYESNGTTESAGFPKNERNDKWKK